MTRRVVSVTDDVVTLIHRTEQQVPAVAHTEECCQALRYEAARGRSGTAREQGCQLVCQRCLLVFNVRLPGKRRVRIKILIHIWYMRWYLECRHIEHSIYYCNGSATSSDIFRSMVKIVLRDPCQAIGRDGGARKSWLDEIKDRPDKKTAQLFALANDSNDGRTSRWRIYSLVALRHRGSTTPRNQKSREIIT